MKAPGSCYKTATLTAISWRILKDSCRLGTMLLGWGNCHKVLEMEANLQVATVVALGTLKVSKMREFRVYWPKGVLRAQAEAAGPAAASSGTTTTSSSSAAPVLCQGSATPPAWSIVARVSTAASTVRAQLSRAYYSVRGNPGS